MRTVCVVPDAIHPLGLNRQHVGPAERQEICRLQCLDGSGLVGQGCEGGGLSGQARTVEQSDICEITLPGSLSYCCSW